MEDKRIQLMRDGKISKAVLTMSYPAILGLLVQAIYNIVDTMYVSWLGPNETGATQVILPMIMAFSAIGLAIGMGASSYISRLLGEHKKHKAEEVAATSFSTSIIVGIITTIITLLFLTPILNLFGATPIILQLCKEYGFYIALGGLAQIANMTLNNMLRSEGSPKFSMIGMSAGAILNIVLDPLFIFTFGWGIKGAAIATTLSQYITMIILYSYYKGHKTVLTLKIKEASFSKEIYKEIMKIGIPTFCRQILMSISIALLNQGAGTYGGETGIASIGITTRTIMLVSYVIFGFSQGFQPIAGYNYGQKNMKRVREATLFTLGVSFLFAITSFILFFFFGKSVLSIYKPTPEVLELGFFMSKLFMLSMVFMSLTNIISVFYQALGKGTKAFLLAIARQGIFFIPIILILPRYLGIHGVGYSQAIADGLTLLLTLSVFIPDAIKLKNL